MLFNKNVIGISAEEIALISCMRMDAGVLHEEPMPVL